MRKTTSCCAFVALVLAGVTSAQAMQSAEIVMRRPVPTTNGTGDATTQPTQPADPGTVDPKPMTPPKLANDGYDPADPQDPDRPVDLGYYYWDKGPWQGSGTCGSTDAKLYRTVSCVSTFKGAPGTDTEWSYAQRKVDPSNCTEEAPPTSMTGEGANCGYELITSDWSPWSNSCSPSATRTRTVQCKRSDGVLVHTDFCRLDLQVGGQSYEQYVDAKEEGEAVDGCNVKWAYHYEGNPSSTQCAGTPPAYSYNYVARCVVDASWLTYVSWSSEDVCVSKGQGSQPRNDPSQGMACNFYNHHNETACTGAVMKDGTMKVSYAAGGSVFEQGYKFCSDMRASCMTYANDPRDANPSDATPAAQRYRTITCHEGYETTSRPGLPATHAGPAAFTAFSTTPPAYQWRDVPRSELVGAR